MYLCVCVLILTAGHLKDPTGRPEHGETQHRVVEIDLIFGKSGFDPHLDTARRSSEGSCTHTNTHQSAFYLSNWNRFVF